MAADSSQKQSSDCVALDSLDPEVRKRFWNWQTRTIFATMVGYALFYFVRKNFSLAMPGLEAEMGISKTSLGIFLTLNGLVYGLSRFFYGLIADRCNARVLMTLGLFLCAAANFAFGFAPDFAQSWTGVSSGPAFTTVMITFMGILWVLNGWLQGSGFPPCARLLTHWIPPKELATKMSLWNTSHSIGAFIVVVMCGYIMGNSIVTELNQHEKRVSQIVAFVPAADGKTQELKVLEETVLEDKIVKTMSLKASDAEKTLPTERILSQEPVELAKVGTSESATPMETAGTAETVEKVEKLVYVNQKVRVSNPEIVPNNIVANLQKGLGFGTGAWRWCFWIPAGFAFLGAIGLWFSLRDTPTSVGLPELPGTGKVALGKGEAPSKSFLRRAVFANRFLWTLGIANFFVYVVRFSVLDWGPTLLSESKHVSLAHAGWLVAAFEISGILGMLFSGWATDRFLKGLAHRTCVFCMAGTALFVTLFWLVPETAPIWMLIFPLCGAGFCIYGPQALIGIAAANQATKRAAATANGFTGLFGYASVVVSGVGVGALAQHLGWTLVYFIMILIAVIGMGIFLFMWNAPRDGYAQLGDEE